MKKCPQCMRDWNGSQCSVCSYEAGRSAKVFVALPPETLLSGRYRLGNALAESRQAVAYAAWDDRAQQAVLLEEFYPKSNVTRNDNGQVVSRRNPALFEQARATFAQRQPQAGKQLSLIDSFQAGGTAWRVYQPLPEVALDEQADALLDTPLLFRDEQGAVMMTINALPMPELPARRAFMPSGSIARKRRRRALRRGIIALFALLALILGAWFVLSMRSPVTMTLDVPLYPDQRVELSAVVEDAKAEDITDAVRASEIKALSDEPAFRQTYSFARSLKRGEYKLTVFSADGVEGMPTEFQVPGSEANTISINELPLKPRLSFGSEATPGSEGAQFVARLQELGYLDLGLQYSTLDEKVQAAFDRFAKDNAVAQSDHSPGVYPQAWDKLMAGTVQAVPYLRKGDQGERATQVVERLKQLYYLFIPAEGYDDAAQAAYKEFIAESGLSQTASDEISAQNAAALFSNNAPKRKPAAVIGQPASDEVRQLMTKLREQGLIDEKVEQEGIFTEAVYAAYEQFVTTAPMRKPVRDQADDRKVYLFDTEMLMAALPTPTPAPTPIPRPEKALFYQLGAQGKLMMALPGQEARPADGYVMPDLLPVKVSLGANAYAIDSVRFSLIEEKDGAGNHVDIKRQDLQASEGILLPKGQRFQVLSVVKGHVFPSLGAPFLPEELAQAKLELSADWRAIDDFIDNATLPLPSGVSAWVEDGVLRFEPEQDGPFSASLQKLFERKQRILREQAAGKEAEELRFYPIRLAQASSFAPLYSGDSPLIPGLRFKLSYLPKRSLSAAELEKLMLPSGQYTLSQVPEDGEAGALMQELSFEVTNAEAQLDPAFLPLPVRARLKLSHYRLGGQDALLVPEGLQLSEALRTSLVQADEKLVELNLKDSLPEMARDGLGAQLIMKDGHGSRLSSLSADAKVEVEPGSYSLMVSQYESEKLSVSLSAPAVFRFAPESVKAIELLALKGLKPAFMYTLSDDKNAPELVFADVQQADLDKTHWRDIFADALGQEDAYRAHKITFAQHDWRSASPVEAVRMWYPGVIEEPAAQTLPLAARTGNRLNFESYVPADAKPVYYLQPLAAPNAAADVEGQPDQTPAPAAAITVFSPSQASGYEHIAVLDFLATMSEAKAVLPPGEAEYSFHRKASEHEAIAKVRFDASALDKKGIHAWVLLPAPGEYLIKADGNVLGSMRVNSNVKPTFTRQQPGQTATPAPAATPTAAPTDAGSATEGEELVQAAEAYLASHSDLSKIKLAHEAVKARGDLGSQPFMTPASRSLIKTLRPDIDQSLSELERKLDKLIQTLQ